MADKDVVLTLTRAEALSLEVAADKGLRVIEALELVKNTGAIVQAARKLKDALR
jgi:molybdenum-dependent DNA-binding transcriptional regulator ModE